MSSKIGKAWFVRVGPFGGLLPCSWEGFLTLIVGVSIVAFMGVSADSMSHAGHVVDGQRLDLACVVGGILLYVFAAAKSKRNGK